MTTRPALPSALRRGQAPPAWVRIPANLLVRTALVPGLRLADRLGLYRLLFRPMGRMASRIFAGGFGDYRPAAGDVVVCSYFKSGTNWSLQIVTQIANRGAVEFEHIHDLVPWPEAPGPFPVIDIRDPAPGRASPTGPDAPLLPRRIIDPPGTVQGRIAPGLNRRSSAFIHAKLERSTPL